MDTVPDAWPPEGGDASTTLVPMFPLPNAFLLPGTIIQLDVFEPRYTRMIEDCLDGPGRIVEEINVGLPDRDNPIARAGTPRASEIIKHLFHALHLGEREDA